MVALAPQARPVDRRTSRRAEAAHPKLSEPELAELWRAYIAHRDETARQKLIIHYAWLVRHVLGRLAVALPSTLDFDDLLGHGTVALVEAVDRFEPDRGVRFETYAAQRIRGAILDAVRAMDTVSRPARRRMRWLSDATVQLSRALGRVPSDEELAEFLGVNVSELWRHYRHLGTSLISLDAVPVIDDEEAAPNHEVYADARQVDPADAAVRSEWVGVIREAIGELPEREQLVLALYYNEGLNLREIGEVLGLSESRVCQLHSKALLFLRGRLLERYPELPDENPTSFAAALCQA
jgi:RNA polymerase sigma factor for flagellar operon FliA